MTAGPGRVDLDLTLPTTPEQVWNLWTTREGLARWWWSHFPDATHDIDCRPGGRWRIASAAVGIAVGGTYLEVDGPARLSFTWTWTDADGDGPADRVDVRFTPVAGGTRVDLAHTGSSFEPGQADDYRQAWQDVLGELARVLDGRS